MGQENIYAVFESLGDDWEQVTVWLDVEKAKNHLNSWRERVPHRYFVVLKRTEF